MLYKNLPEKELHGVMLVRALLDYVAAAKFLVSGNISDFKAVLKARCEYRKIKHLYSAKRAENMQKATQTVIPERVTFSILWQYYVKGRKLFRDLFVAR